LAATAIRRRIRIKLILMVRKHETFGLTATKRRKLVVVQKRVHIMLVLPVLTVVTSIQFDSTVFQYLNC
jgi:hypothetical protein